MFSIPFIYWQFVALLVLAVFYALAAGPVAPAAETYGLPGVSMASASFKLRLPILKPQTYALSLMSATAPYPQCCVL